MSKWERFRGFYETEAEHSLRHLQRQHREAKISKHNVNRRKDDANFSVLVKISGAPPKTKKEKAKGCDGTPELWEIVFKFPVEATKKLKSKSHVASGS